MPAAEDEKSFGDAREALSDICKWVEKYHFHLLIITIGLSAVSNKMLESETF